MTISPTPLKPPDPTVNQILEVFVGPCAAPVYAIVGLLAFDTLQAFWQIFSPNWKDTVKEGPGRTSWLHQLEVIMEDTEEVDPVWFVYYLKYAFVAFEFLDIFAFWFMVAFATTEGLIKWTSTVWQMSPCARSPFLHYVYSKHPVGQWDGVIKGYQVGPVWENITTTEPDTQWPSGWAIPPNQNVEFTYMIQVANEVSGLPYGMDVRIVDGDSGGVYWENLFDQEHHDANYSSGLFEKFVSHPTQTKHYRAEYRCTDENQLLIGCKSGHFALKWSTRDPTGLGQ